MCNSSGELEALSSCFHYLHFIQYSKQQPFNLVLFLSLTKGQSELVLGFPNWFSNLIGFKGTKDGFFQFMI